MMTRFGLLRILISEVESEILLLLFSLDYWIAIFYAQDPELALEEALKVAVWG